MGKNSNSMYLEPRIGQGFKEVNAATGPHHDGPINSTSLKPGPAGRTPRRAEQEELSMSFKIIDSLLFWEERLDVLSLKLVNKLLNVT
jgi:hypothetical protein